MGFGEFHAGDLAGLALLPQIAFQFLFELPVAAAVDFHPRALQHAIVWGATDIIIPQLAQHLSGQNNDNLAR